MSRVNPPPEGGTGTGSRGTAGGADSGVGVVTMTGGGSIAPMRRITIDCRRRRRAVTCAGFMTRGFAIDAASKAASDGASVAADFPKYVRAAASAP